jgi:4-hydroxy-tetrahydrodipicolinate synthase
VIRGVYAIPPTPFDATGALDEASLVNVIEFCIRSGAHGIVTPVNASEFTTLLDAERLTLVETAAQAVAGRVPLVVGVTGTSAAHSAVFAEHARGSGASAVIAMPPYPYHPDLVQIVSYYTAVARAAQLPVWVQNHLPPVGTPMGVATLGALLEIDGVEYIKEECKHAGHLMSEVRNLANGRLKGFMGGRAGRHLLNEFRRGSDGTMPACEVVDLHVELWRRLDDGDAPGARELHEAMLPLLTLEEEYGVAIYKEVLFRRGVIGSTFVRQPGIKTLDAADRAELDDVLGRLRPWFPRFSYADACR